MSRTHRFQRACGSDPARAARLACALALLGGLASAQQVAFKAELQGQQAVPPATTTALGTAWFVVDLAADTLTTS